MITRGVRCTIMERLIYKDDYVTVKVLFDKSVEHMLKFQSSRIIDVGGYVLLETNHPIPDSPSTYVQNEVTDMYFFKDYNEFRADFKCSNIMIVNRHMKYRLWCESTARMLVSADSNTYCIDSKGLVLLIEFSSSLNNGIIHTALPRHNLGYKSSHIPNIGDLL